MTQALQQDVEYVEVRRGHREPTSFNDQWLEQASEKHPNPELIAADALRRLYPGYSLIVSEDYRLTNLLALPDVTAQPLDGSKPVLNVLFSPANSRIGGELTGSLVESVIFGSYDLSWKEHHFVVHITKIQLSNMMRTAYFILHDGPEQRVRDLLLATSLYAEQIHDEVWVFNQGMWQKNKSLWNEIKDSSWDDVVMKEPNKKSLQKDVYGFFDSEETYKNLSIPWKRGLILHGPPGNGKTISIKVIMKTCADLGFTPLYVRSFQSFQGEEVAMQSVFLKARQVAPCVLILEDLDSLINDKNRSFFLNQLDGLEGNNGLLVIASTNHFDRLDAGLSNRPSRFDRKYLFDDPDYQERVLYAKYWQEKLEDKDEISFPDSLVEEVAELTQGFSFAYLKEAFVATLVRISNADEGEEVAFPDVLKSQIKSLAKELVKPTPTDSDAVPHPPMSKVQPEDGPGEPDSPPTTIRPMRWADLKAGRTGTTPRLQGCVLPAPPSAYPQVMPGSLPPLNTDRSQEPVPAVRHVTSPGTRNSDGGRRNPFSPSIQIHDHVEATQMFGGF